MITEEELERGIKFKEKLAEIELDFSRRVRHLENTLLWWAYNRGDKPYENRSEQRLLDEVVKIADRRGFDLGYKK